MKAFSITTVCCLFTSAFFAAAFPVFEDGKVLESRDLEKRFPPQPTLLYPGKNFTKDPLTVFYLVLNTQPDPDWNMLQDLVTFDITYVSLTYDNDILHQIMPWAGTHYKVGPQVFIDIFTQVGQYWERGPFTIDFMFGEGGNLTAWGQFTAKSRTTGITVLSPWAARARVNEDMKVFEFQWMEDTFTTAMSFWDNNTTKRYLSYPGGGEVWA